MAASRFLERLILRQCIADLLEAGFTITVNDGEDEVLCDSTDADAIFKATRSTDEDYFLARKNTGPNQFTQGWVRFIYGNEGWDVINDYTTNLEAVLTKTNALIDEMTS